MDYSTIMRVQFHETKRLEAPSASNFTLHDTCYAHMFTHFCHDSHHLDVVNCNEGADLRVEGRVVIKSNFNAGAKLDRVKESSAAHRGSTCDDA